MLYIKRAVYEKTTFILFYFFRCVSRNPQKSYFFFAYLIASSYTFPRLLGANYIKLNILMTALLSNINSCYQKSGLVTFRRSKLTLFAKTQRRI